MDMSQSHYQERTISICMPKQTARQLYSPQPICVEVKFELKYSYFNRLHKAIDLLSDATLKRLFPTNEQFSPKPQIVNPNLPLPNKYRKFFTLEYGQRDALKMIVYAKPKAPVIVAGSFGSGKTRILATSCLSDLNNKQGLHRHPRHNLHLFIFCVSRVSVLPHQ